MIDPHEFVSQMNLLFEEFKEAKERYPDFNSAHEGWAVIKEELDELWEEVRKYPNANTEAMKKEAKQIGAMALRFMVDICS